MNKLYNFSYKYTSNKLYFYCTLNQFHSKEKPYRVKRITASNMAKAVRLSKYKTRIIEHIEQNPSFILPIERRNEILTRLTSNELEDISISRTTVKWGIQVPDSHHTIYVWFDALLNYLCHLDRWPAALQIIGKDIIWFHAVVFSGILFSLDLPLPTTIFAHGFVVDEFGKKMAKSVGNVVDPITLMDKYGCDAVRYYFAKAKLGDDFKYSKLGLEKIMTVN